MNTEQLLIDGVLNLESLLLKKSNHLKLEAEEIIFILKIIPILKKNKITEKEIYKKLIIKKKDLDTYLSSLLKNKYVKTFFRKSEDNVIFDFFPLWEKLLQFYQTPTEDSTFEEKSKWFLNMLDFENDSYILETLSKWINEKDFKHIVDLVSKVQLSELKNISWNSFVTIHDKLFEKNTKNNKNTLKEIINLNWLE
ncbi:MAG: hypothetical protein HPAVJP_1830 [Candidatus Hepatoplasma vulgare]|nr:MAG: hypothetical protein HPAVJP_1830 [Candidatus Hepatoplasma sp.]